MNTNQVIKFHQQQDQLFVKAIKEFTDSSDWFKSDSVLLLFILYATIVFGGVFGNVTLIFSICSHPTSRRRKPLLFCLCVADMLVLVVSAPISIAFLSLSAHSWTLGLFGCKVMQFFKVNSFAV